jgi:hypothetical protein
MYGIFKVIKVNKPTEVDWGVIKGSSIYHRLH